MKQCSQCGKEISEEEYLENETMCTDCFLEYYQQIDEWESEE